MNYDTWKTSPPFDNTPDLDGENVEFAIVRDGLALWVDTCVGDVDAVVVESDDEARFPPGSVVLLERDERIEAEAAAIERAMDREAAKREDAYERDPFDARDDL